MTENNVLSKCGLTISLRLWGPSTDYLVLCVGKGVGWSHLHALLTCFHCYIIVTCWEGSWLVTPSCTTYMLSSSL